MHGSKLAGEKENQDSANAHTEGGDLQGIQHDISHTVVVILTVEHSNQRNRGGSSSHNKDGCDGESLNAE